EVDRLGGAEARVIAALAAHGQALDTGIDPAVQKAHRLGHVIEEAVAAALGLERKDEGAVGVDVDLLDRIHLDGDGEAHGRVPLGWGDGRDYRTARAARERPGVS